MTIKTDENRNIKKSIEPIRTKDDVEKVRKILCDNPRNLLLFDFATLTGIGMKHILALKVGDLLGIHYGDSITIDSYRKSGTNDAVMSKKLYLTWKEYLDKVKPSKTDFIFKSRKGHSSLNISSVSYMIAIWFQKAGLEISGGAKSLQKTWARHYKSDTLPIRVPAGTSESISLINPVKVETVKEKVYRELARTIFTGRLAPGERLLEAKIAEQLQVSRMPVREALHRLEEAGFVSASKSVGKVVNSLSKQNLEEIIHIRILLENEAARIATEKRTSSSLKRLEQINVKMNKAVDRNDIDKVLGLNKQFHIVMYEDAQMPILQQIIGAMWDRVSPYIHILMRESDALSLGEHVKRNHKGILQGFNEKDTKKVCKWITKDILEGREMVSNLLDKLNSSYLNTP